MAEYVEHLAQIKMGKEKRKEKTERERMERLIREYSDIDWVGLYNSDKLSSLRVDELLLYFSHHKIILKGKKQGRPGGVVEYQYTRKKIDKIPQNTPNSSKYTQK